MDGITSEALMVPLLLAFTVAAAAGQETAVFSASSDLVVLHAAVTDDDGRYVAGLTKRDFVVEEEGTPQTVGFFAAEDAPVTVGMVVDASGSMYENRERVIAALTAFAQGSHPEDEFFALAFNERVEPVLPAGAPFTSSATTLARALTAGIRARGRTALYDAVTAGLDYVAGGSRSRQALIVLSDGGDNASRTTRDALLRRAQASNAVIYSVALIDPLARGADPGLLKSLAEVSGGEAYRPRSIRGVGDTLRRIGRDIRGGYTLGYVSANTARDGTFRRVRVRARGADGRPLEVRTRTGYVAASWHDVREAVR